MQIQVREYGSPGPKVILLHGGPGASGYMAPVARALAETFQVIEPFQRGSGGEPLTVVRHIADLRELVAAHCSKQSPAIVGHSWGAMLALAYAAAHPDTVACLVLIGCGTFDVAARDRVDAARKDRMDDEIARRMAGLEKASLDPDRRLLATGRLMQQVDSYELIPTEDETRHCDARAHEETWQDMLRLQADGVYPAAFASIHSPAIMLHGTADPHPGRMIHAGLKRHLPQLQYREWERCGHYPWLEKAVDDEFYTVLQAWLSRNMPFAQTPVE